MKILVSENAREYADNLRRYATETGKSFSTALAREGPDFKQELYKQFHAIRPEPESIYEAARSRSFRVRRSHSTTLVKTERGLSQRALRRAGEILNGQKTDLFRQVASSIVPVRFSAKTRGVVTGGKQGNRFAKSVMRAHQLTDQEFARASRSKTFRSMGARRLNRWALAVYLELAYRRRGAQGGTMAVQWLFPRWRRQRIATDAKFIQHSATGIPIGTVDFQTDREGNLSDIVFKGFVPGTGERAAQRGVLEKVFAARSPKLLSAILQHQAKRKL